jgi:hypothetical protein
LNDQSLKNLSELNHQRSVQDDIAMRAQIQSLLAGGTPQLDRRAAPTELSPLDLVLRQLQSSRQPVDPRLLSAATGNSALAGQLASLLYGGPPSGPVDTLGQGAPMRAGAASLPWQDNTLSQNHYLDHLSILQPASRGSHEAKMLQRHQQLFGPQPGHSAPGELDPASALLLRRYLQPQGGSPISEPNQDMLSRIALLESHILRSRLPSNVAPNATPESHFHTRGL